MIEESHVFSSILLFASSLCETIFSATQLCKPLLIKMNLIRWVDKYKINSLSQGAHEGAISTVKLNLKKKLKFTIFLKEIMSLVYIFDLFA